MSTTKSASGYSDEDLAKLTDEEREALLDVEEGDDPADGDEGQDGPDEPEPKQAAPADKQPSGDAPIKPQAETKPGAQAANDQAASAAAVEPEPKPAASERAPREQSFPKFDAPADAAAKLDEIEGKLLSLANRFDEGEITAKEFYSEQRAIHAEERTVRDGLLMAQMSEQAQSNAFTASVDRFLAAHPAYVPGTPAYAALDAEVRRLQTSTGDPFDPQHLADAHDNLMTAFGGGALQKSGKTTTDTRRPEPPPTLGGVAASDMQTISSNEFGHLDRLQGADYEAALAKLSPEQQARYLAS